MKTITIKGSKRESVGKVATKALRNAEKVPCVLYGGGEPIHFSAEEKSFKNLVYTPDVFTVLIELEGDTSYSAILKDIQFHPVSDRILHIDFFQLHEDKEIIMNIPVRLVGNSIGVLRGGVLRRNRRTLRVKALPKNLPDFIEADITKMRIGSKLYIREIELDNCIIVDSESAVVCQVRTSRVAVDDTEDEEEEGKEGESSENTETDSDSKKDE